MDSPWILEVAKNVSSRCPLERTEHGQCIQRALWVSVELTHCEIVYFLYFSVFKSLFFLSKSSYRWTTFSAAHHSLAGETIRYLVEQDKLIGLF